MHEQLFKLLSSLIIYLPSSYWPCKRKHEHMVMTVMVQAVFERGFNTSCVTLSRLSSTVQDLDTVIHSDCHLVALTLHLFTSDVFSLECEKF